jgi:hypothetical protein
MIDGKFIPAEEQFARRDIFCGIARYSRENNDDKQKEFGSRNIYICSQFDHLPGKSGARKYIIINSIIS